MTFFKRMLRFYSFMFRMFGLVMALLSFVVVVALGVAAAKTGYVVVQGVPNHSVIDVLGIVLAPLAGVLAGLCLYFFVPKVEEPRKDPSG